jgi:plastocyanin
MRRPFSGVMSSILLVAVLLAGSGPAHAVSATCGPTLSVVSSPLVGEQGAGIRAMTAISSTDLWAVGFYGPIETSSGTLPLTEHWDGTAWTFVPSPQPPDAYNQLAGASAISSTDVWAVGWASDSFRWDTWTQHWDGSAWTHVPSPSTEGNPPVNYLVAVAAVSHDDIWAVGSNQSDQSIPLIEHWDGGRWTIYPTDSIASVPYLGSISALSATDIWAVGGGGAVVHWDGSTWSLVPGPHAGNLRGVAAISTADVWAVGETDDGDTVHPLIEHWDGNAWSVVPGPDNPDVSSYLTTVAAVAPGDVWAVGGDFGTPTRSVVEHWDGQRWSVVFGPHSGIFESSTGMAVTNTGEVWTGGILQTSADTVSQPLYEHICPIQVRDSGFSPSRVKGVAAGDTVAWSIPSTDVQSHTITDPTGRRLFDSAIRQPGSSFTFTFRKAGTYRVIDRVTSHRGSVRVK